MNFLDLFSGIGGFALGAEWAGFTFDRHFFSEVDPYAIKVYQRRFPDAIGLGDIRNINGADLPSGDWILSGGFPCQDISIAGKGAGLAGERSGLFYEYARLIGQLRPRFAVMENVGALAFRGLDSVLGTLSEIGYDAEWQDIRASDVGAPHRRERLWIVAYTNTERINGPGKAWYGRDEPTNRSTDVAYPMRERSTSGMAGQIEREARETGIADDRSPEIGRPEDTMAYATDGGNVRLHGQLGATEEVGRLDGRGPRDGGGEWWEAEPGVGRVVDGVPNRVDRLKCLGNAIVPHIAAMIFDSIAKLEGT